MWMDDESQPTEVRIVRVLDNLHFNLGKLVGLFEKQRQENAVLTRKNQLLTDTLAEMEAEQQLAFAQNEEASWPEIQEAREEGK